MHDRCATVAAHLARSRDAGYNGAASNKEGRMPEVVVYALGGRTPDQKKGLMKEITDAVVKNFSVPPEAVVVTLVETERQSKMKGGVLFSEMGQR
jgi:4-oxalocrotonate tautomerase